MKKTILILMIAVTILVMPSCSLKKCDICNGFGADNEVQAVTTWYLCDDCYYDFLKKVDYDYGNSNNRCSDCGKSIPSGRYYCDKCLGYGTCQDCGKKISDSRLYCNDCLYN